MTSLQYGANLNAENIKEGDDIYFECIVQARPPVTKLQWFHNVSNLTTFFKSSTTFSFLIKDILKI